MARLRIQRPDGDTYYTLDKDNIVVGRLESADIVLPDPAVSRVHARVVEQGGVHLVMDLQSRKGTRVNDQPVEDFATQLNDGDRIDVGGVLLTYER